MKTRSQIRTEEQKSQDCSICLQKMNDYVITLCNHVFCDSCLIQHLLNNQTCPLCRKECNPEDIISQIMNEQQIILFKKLKVEINKIIEKSNNLNRSNQTINRYEFQCHLTIAEMITISGFLLEVFIIFVIIYYISQYVKAHFERFM